MFYFYYDDILRVCLGLMLHSPVINNASVSQSLDEAVDNIIKAEANTEAAAETGPGPGRSNPTFTGTKQAPARWRQAS